MEFISKLREQAILGVNFDDDDQNTEFFHQYRERMQDRNKYARKSYYKKYLELDRSLINMFMSYSIGLDSNETRFSYNLKQIQLYHKIIYEYIFMLNTYNRKYFYPKGKKLNIHEINCVNLSDPDKININKMIDKDRNQLKTMFEEIYQDELTDKNKEYYFTD